MLARRHRAEPRPRGCGAARVGFSAVGVHGKAPYDETGAEVMTSTDTTSADVPECAPDPAGLSDRSFEIAAAISGHLQRSGLTVSVAESLTSGSLACHLGAAEGSGEWFSGGVIAYAERVKFTVLGVEPGPVVSAQCARQMARGVAALTGSDLGLAVTGVGGPGPTEGKPAGTVFIALWSPNHDEGREYHLEGDPAEVVRAATRKCLELLAASFAAD
jgi:nicotinamide-nucleotide amidase